MFIFRGYATVLNRISVVRDLANKLNRILLVSFILILSGIYSHSNAQILVALAPRQIVSGDGVIEAAGAPPTATVPTAVAEQPLAKVTVKL